MRAFTNEWKTDSYYIHTTELFVSLLKFAWLRKGGFIIVHKHIEQTQLIAFYSLEACSLLFRK